MAIDISDSGPAVNAVRVIGSKDDAIDKKASDWEEYKKELDEKHLVFVSGKSPTIFVCNFNLTAKQAKMVNNAMLGAKDDAGKPQLAYGSWGQTVAKITLKSIENPDYVPADKQIKLKKDASGYVHDDLLAKLERWGVVDDIFGAFVTLTKEKDSAEDTKNS